MLVLSRKVDQKIELGNGEVVITITRIFGNRVNIGIDAPPETKIYRSEARERMSATIEQLDEQQEQDAAQTGTRSD